MSATGVYLILFTIANRHLSLGVVTEHNSTLGKSVNDIHLCKNLRLGLWISLNLSLPYIPELASLNSTLLKFLIALDSGKQDLEKSRTSLKWENSQLPMEELDLGGDLTYSERPVKILDTAEQVTRNKVIKMCKVQWSHHTEDEATWEHEEELRADYPELFPSASWILRWDSSKGGRFVTPTFYKNKSFVHIGVHIKMHIKL
jgi:hypothetical protein